jgi:hypothetical protein
VYKGINTYKTFGMRQELVVCIVLIACSPPCVSSPLGSCCSFGVWVSSNNFAPIDILRMPDELSNIAVVALKCRFTFFRTSDECGWSDGQCHIRCL